MSSFDDLDKPRKGTGLVFAKEFNPASPSITPDQLFSGRKRQMGLERMVHRDDSSKGLIYTDGACLDNGMANPRAGWGFHHGFATGTFPGVVGFPQPRAGEPSVAGARLEKKGPFGDDGPQTSNRAELRAVIAALGFRFWPGEGFNTLVFATDSTYVVDGATKWTKTWTQNGWVTSTGEKVMNRDLWEMLLGEFERWKEEGLAIEFWKIPRELNALADAAAKKAAAEQDAPEAFRKIHGMAF